MGFPGGSGGKASDPLEKEMAPHSSTLAWKIPWTEEPRRLQSMESQSRTLLSNFIHLRSEYVKGTHMLGAGIKTDGGLPSTARARCSLCILNKGQNLIYLWRAGLLVSLDLIQPDPNQFHEIKHSGLRWPLFPSRKDGPIWK